MDIKSSLVIVEKNPNVICMIKVGHFVRFYNQSYYLVTQQYGKQLNPIAGYIKKAKNRFVIYSGFPFSKVQQTFPDAVPTAWGFKIDGDFDVAGYDRWLAQQVVLASGEALACLPATAEPPMPKK